MSARRAGRRAVATGLALAAACSPPAAPPPASVLLITVDTLRADHVGACGDPRGATPGIDRLLRGAVQFETALAPRGQTWPSLATLMTSVPPVTHGVRKNGQPLEPGLVSLADVLRGRGYATAAFLANAGKAAWSGFDEVTDLRDLDLPVAARAKGWLRGRAGAGPFLLWVHLFSPHAPYAAPAPLTTRFDPAYTGPFDGSLEQIRAIERGELAADAADVRHLVARYDAEVAWVDARVRDLVRSLEELDLAGSTVVAFAADHGEELHERNRYFSHSASVFDTVLRVPLALRVPAFSRAGTIVRGPAELMDVAPTILARLGADAPPGWEGRDLSAALSAGAPLPEDHAAFAELEDRVVSVRTGRWRYVHNPDGFDFPLEAGGSFPLPRAALYDHAADPGERRDVSAANPETAARLRDAATAWMVAHGWGEASRRHADRTIPEATRRELEALGYVN